MGKMSASERVEMEGGETISVSIRNSHYFDQFDDGKSRALDAAWLLPEEKF
jgi:hypothetical protein